MDTVHANKFAYLSLTILIRDTCNYTFFEDCNFLLSDQLAKILPLHKGFYF